MSRATRLLLVFAASCLLLDLVLLVLPVNERMVASGYAAALLIGEADEDSWAGMRRGVALVAGGTNQVGELYRAPAGTERVAYLYPPSSLLPLELLRWLGGEGALRNRVLNSLGRGAVIALVVVCLLIVRDGAAEHGLLSASRRERLVQAAGLAALAFTFYPLLRSWYLGQVQTFISLLQGCAIWALLRRRDAAAGAALGLAVTVKPHYLAAALWAVLRRRGRFFVAMGLVAGGLSMVALVRYGAGVHRDYRRAVGVLTERGEIYEANQSANGLLLRWFSRVGSERWDPVRQPAFDRRVYAGTVGAAVVLLAFGLFAGWRRAPRGGPNDLCLLRVATTAAAPTAWEHHYGVLLPVFAYLLPRAVALRPFGAGTGAWLALTFLFASRRLAITERLESTALNPLQSYLFFAALSVLVGLWRLGRCGSNPARRGRTRRTAAAAQHPSPP